MSFDYTTMFMIGFLSSFAHCIGMCGGFVLTYSLSLAGQPGGAKSRTTLLSIPHLLYNSGRLVSYVALGLFFGLAGEVVISAGGFRYAPALLMLAAGIFMVLLALEMGGWLRQGWNFQLPGFSRLHRLTGPLLSKINRKNVFSLGMLNGLMPCGLVYAAGAKAASTGAVESSVLTMLFFGLGTFPAMFLLGVSAGKFSARFRNKLFKAATVLVILFGIATTVRGTDVLINIETTGGPQTQTHCE